jgi:hypothetical protein
MTLTPRDKRMLQVLGVVAGLAILYFVITTVLGGDSGEVASPTGATGGPVPTATPPVSESASPTPRETLPPVDLAGERDPFSIPPGLSTGTPSGSVSPSVTTTVPPTTFPPTTAPPTTFPPTTPPPTSPPPTSPPPTSPPPPPPSNEVVVGGHHVVLGPITPNGKKLKIDVDGDTWTVEEGALFAQNFRLVNIDGNCARFLFGDQSFTLCNDP